jgi:hypothetical protein
LAPSWIYDNSLSTLWIQQKCVKVFLDISVALLQLSQLSECHQHIVSQENLDKHKGLASKSNSDPLPYLEQIVTNLLPRQKEEEREGHLV